MKKIFYIIIFVLASSCKKVPPETKALINEETYTFENNGLYLTAFVPQVVEWNEPKNINDCLAGTNRRQKSWSVENNTDFIEVTIFFSDGVKPGNLNSRSFGLRNELLNGTSSIKAIPLTMESGNTNPYLLFQVTWRFSFAAIEDLLNEVVLTGKDNSATPFERKLPNPNILGSKWILTVPAGVKTENVYATIKYDLHMGNINLCP